MGRTGRLTAAVVVVGMALLGALPASGAGVGDADVAYGGGDGVASVVPSVLGTVADLVALPDGSTVVLVQAASTSELVRVDAVGAVVAGFGGTVAASLSGLQLAPDGTFWGFGSVDPDPFTPGVAGAVAHFGTDGRTAGLLLGRRPG